MCFRKLFVSRIPEHLLFDLFKQFPGRFWPSSFQGLRLLNTCQQGDMSFADQVLQVPLSPVFLGALSFKKWVEIVKKNQKNRIFVVMILGFVWLNQFSSSLSSSRSRLKSSSSSCFKENRLHFAMISDATEIWAGNVKQMDHWSLKGIKSPVYHTSYTGNVRRKGQLVVKVDDLLSQQTLNHQPDTRPVIMHLSLTWRRVRAANAWNSEGMCHGALITKQPVPGVSQWIYCYTQSVWKNGNCTKGPGNSWTNFDHSAILLSPAEPKPRHRICHRGRWVAR